MTPPLTREETIAELRGMVADPPFFGSDFNPVWRAIKSAIAHLTTPEPPKTCETCETCRSFSQYRGATDGVCLRGITGPDNDRDYVSPRFGCTLHHAREEQG